MDWSLLPIVLLLMLLASLNLIVAMESKFSKGWCNWLACIVCFAAAIKWALNMVEGLLK